MLATCREPPPDPELGDASKAAVKAAKPAAPPGPSAAADDAGVLSGQSVATVHREHDADMDAARTKEVCPAVALAGTAEQY